jgi:tripartite-type tricarboxylate transporter receptor subunit TctC
VAHFITEHWKRAVNIEIEHIPYKGEPQAIQDLLAGRLQIYISPSPYLDFVANGKLKALATTGPRRTQIQSNIPTMDELGFPTASMSVLFGLYAPANLPPDIAKKISGAALEALKMPSVQKQINDFGYITRAEGPEKMKEIVQEEFIKFKNIAKEANILTDQ